MSTNNLQNWSVTAGYVILTYDNNVTKSIPISDVLRAADIPALTSSNVASLKALANLIVILIRTLISRQIIDEDFADDAGLAWELDDLIEAIEDIGGSFHEPTLEDADD